MGGAQVDAGAATDVENPHATSTRHRLPDEPANVGLCQPGDSGHKLADLLQPLVQRRAAQPLGQLSIGGVVVGDVRLYERRQRVAALTQ